MASSLARSARNHEVRQRLDVALEAIAARLGVEIPPEPKRMKDSGLQPIVELERFTTILEGADAAVAERDAAHKVAVAERDARIAELEKQEKSTAAALKTAAARIAELEATQKPTAAKAGKAQP